MNEPVESRTRRSDSSEDLRGRFVLRECRGDREQRGEGEGTGAGGEHDEVKRRPRSRVRQQECGGERPRMTGCSVYKLLTSSYV
jgi:hypothetical protein